MIGFTQHIYISLLRAKQSWLVQDNFIPPHAPRVDRIIYRLFQTGNYIRTTTYPSDYHKFLGPLIVESTIGLKLHNKYISQA